MTAIAYGPFLRAALRENSAENATLPSLIDEMERLHGVQVYADALFSITRLELPAEESRVHFRNILAHRVDLQDCLGRQVSLRAAVCDYFLTLVPRFDEPVLVESNRLASIEKSALVDELTGLPNRRSLNRELASEIERSRRDHRPCSLLMADVDDFKALNDAHGHPAGDQALVHLARVIESGVRLVDRPTRYGGEEFAIILPRTGRAGAALVGERLRRAVEASTLTLPSGEQPGLTISIGAATFPLDAGSAEALLAKSDQALYQAKRSGRNRLCESSGDLRRHTRHPLALPLEWRRVEGEPLPGVTEDLGLGGLLWRPAVPVPIGTAVRVVLTDPEEGIVVPLDAQAVHVRGEGEDVRVGLRLENGSTWRDLYRNFVAAKTGVWH